MTIEEKAKAYDEAIKRAKPLMLDTKFSMKNTVISIFPELKENEDEQIREELIGHCKDLVRKNQDDKVMLSVYEPWLAYLEKQKAKERLDRMAPIYNDKESFESALEKAWKYYNESASRTVDSFEDDYIECVFSKGFREGFLYREKQKEQIPYIDFVIKPHKGDDTNPYDMSVSEAQEYAIKRGFGIPFNDGEVYVDERHITQTIGNIIRWADEHPKEQNLSESCDNICCEDDRFKIIGEAKKDIIEKTNIAENELSMELPLLDGILMRVWQVGWLNKKQKPAEWSKEDEEMRINILQEIANIKDVFPKINIQPEFDWLKSLPERFNLQPKQEWTIEDAKPGDILHTSSTASSKTFIFKGIRNDEHGSVECFCCYDSEDGFRKGEEELIGWKTDKYRLATPKQCIKLGRIMGKAGYIFHFETNKLQKLNKLYWKPSDEQMEVFVDSIYFLEQNGFKDPNGMIESLYQDLKKL